MVVGFLLGFLAATLLGGMLWHHFKLQQLQLEGVVREQKERDLFFAKLSHELKTPLVSIQGWIQMIKMSPNSSLLERAFRAIEQSCLAQACLINDLLDSSRMRAGKFFLRPEESEIEKLILATLENLRPQAEKAGVQIVTRFENLPPQICLDPLRVSQILANLVTNAIKFSPDRGRIEIFAGLKQIDRDVYARIDVRDYGSGIDPAFLPKIFETYTQAPKADTGLGLGLAIAKHLVELHGGKIFARSEGEGKGSVFTIFLPTNRNLESQPVPPDESKEGTNDSTSQQI